MKTLIKKSKIPVCIMFAIIPTLLFGQIDFNGRIENIIGSDMGLSMISEESGMIIQIKNAKGKTQVAFENHLYTISEKKGLVLADATGEEILRSDKKNKFYYTSTGDTLYSKNSKGWDISLTDKMGNVMVQGKYTLQGNDSQIIVEAIEPDLSVIAVVGYHLMKKSKTMAQTNE